VTARRWVAASVATVLLLTGAPAVQAAPTRQGNPQHLTAPRRPVATQRTVARDTGVGPGPNVRTDPALSAYLDQVVIDGPVTCLTVAIDGNVVYHHGDAPLTPASTEKLTTASVALDLLGPDHRFTTRVVAPAAPVRGVVTGDLTLVGGGDPQLTTGGYQSFRKLGDDRALTSLDTLADRVVASGVKRVTGRVVGDESRYDTLRVVPSWPARYVSQEQAGPLSALDVDDGYVLRTVGGKPQRQRAPQPATNAALDFTALLRIKGVQVDGEAAQGTAPAGGQSVASIESDTLDLILGEMLQNSDNQIAELITKELGLASGGAGTTAAGVSAIKTWRADHHLDAAGVTTVDGSGLDPTDKETCDNMVALLDAGRGRSSLVAAGLPVAGVSGTLIRRFRDTPAAGRMRAKTGTLGNVTGLAGFVDLPAGGAATFAYLANGAPVTGTLESKQSLLGTILSTYRPACPPPTAHQVLAPVAAYAGQMGALSAVPAMAAVLPGTIAALAVAERQLPLVADRCLGLDPAAKIILGG
jgi:D-alanyl-D-alanine carboxypeptidase/D-alanyl-D-alanine-endopeptidase (penicillin-binding protein 4)